jgi:DNA-binding CsgD family transcriptional regulator
MGLMAKMKKRIKKPKSRPAKKQEESQFTSRETPYGKMLDLSSEEKLELVESLTPREKETFCILLGGYSLKETAKQLNIGYSTANTYQTSIYKKLHVNSRAELIINYRDLCDIKEE